MRFIASELTGVVDMPTTTHIRGLLKKHVAESLDLFFAHKGTKGTTCDTI